MKIHVVTYPKTRTAFAFIGFRLIRSFHPWENPEDPPRAWRQAICPEEWAGRVMSKGHTVDLSRYDRSAWLE